MIALLWAIRLSIPILAVALWMAVKSEGLHR